MFEDICNESTVFVKKDPRCNNQNNLPQDTDCRILCDNKNVFSAASLSLSVKLQYISHMLRRIVVP